MGAFGQNINLLMTSNKGNLFVFEVGSSVKFVSAIKDAIFRGPRGVWQKTYFLRIFFRTPSLRLNCKDERYLLRRTDKDPKRLLKTRCWWTQKWSKDFSDLKCELTFCGPNPIIPQDSWVGRELCFRTRQLFCTDLQRLLSTAEIWRGLAMGSYTNAHLVQRYWIWPTPKRRQGMNSTLLAFKRGCLKSSRSGLNAEKR